jgi:hypothetical protein
MINENLIDYFESNGFENRADTGKTWKELGDMFNISAVAARSKFCRWKAKQQMEIVKAVYRKDEELYTTYKKQNTQIELDLTDFEIQKVSQNSQGLQWITYENTKKPITKEQIESVLSSITFPQLTLSNVEKSYSGFKILNISDIHIGMSAEGVFNLNWNIEQIQSRFVKILTCCKSDVLVINMLGDYTDGLFKKTDRGKHTLQQNMSNEEMFKFGLDLGLFLIHTASQISNKIIVNWLCNSNHSSFMDYSIGYAIDKMTKLNDRIDFNLIENFIETQSYEIDDKRFDLILTHGYDKELMMRPLPRVLSDKDVNFIEKIIKQNKLEGNVFLIRGDQHRYHDISYSSFRDLMIPSLAPPSGWAQINFGTDYNGGFVINSFDNETISSQLIEF